MSSIGSIGASSMQRPDPLGIFKKTDSDGNGGVSQAELKNLATVIKEKTGKTFEVTNDTFNNYDTNSDGSLSGDELKSVLDNSGFGPPQGMQGMGPPPPPPQQATDSYESNSSRYGQETVSSLVDSLKALLEKITTSNSESNQQSSSDQSSTGSSYDQAGELKKLLEALTKYADSNSSSSNSMISVNS
jgi:hypothetical protein